MKQGGKRGMKTALRDVPLGMDAAFPKAEFDGRIRALRRAMADQRIELYLTHGPENIFYLTGQQTMGHYPAQCLGVPLKGAPFLLTRNVEIFNARANTYLANIVPYFDEADPAVELAHLIERRGLMAARIAFDQDAYFLTANLYKRLVKRLGRLGDGSGLVERLRWVKSPMELDSLAKAARANDAGIKAAVAAIRPGASENDVAAAFMAAAIKAGSEHLGMDPQINSGPRSGQAHATWRRRRIRARETVVLETAACYNRYHAAIFRTVAVGKVPALAVDTYRICKEMMAAAADAIRPGRTCADVYWDAQKVVERHGLGRNRPNRTGYSMGISFPPDWGEGAILHLHRDTEIELVPGMAFHTPCSFRSYGEFCVGLSETLVVTERGCKRLSRLPSELIRV